MTHHFDYGQRYVELLTRPSGLTPYNLEILGPPAASFAPAGYYLLFLLDGNGRPSDGKFVRLSY